MPFELYSVIDVLELDWWGIITTSLKWFLCLQFVQWVGSKMAPYGVPASIGGCWVLYVLYVAYRYVVPPHLQTFCNDGKQYLIHFDFLWWRIASRNGTCPNATILNEVGM